MTISAISPICGPQVLRWMRLAETGKLPDEYRQQFPSDDTIAQRKDDQVLVQDAAVRELRRTGRKLALHWGRMITLVERGNCWLVTGSTKA